MQVTDQALPVDLLRDHRGIIGIGVNDHIWQQWPGVPKLILRPDLIDVDDHCYAVLQRINGGFRRGIFDGTAEEYLRGVIHHEALIRYGLPWPPHQPGASSYRERWWSSDKAQQDRNCKIYHGFRVMSLRVINKLIEQALADAADRDRAARSQVAACTIAAESPSSIRGCWF
jgi:hypothetical protein